MFMLFVSVRLDNHSGQTRRTLEAHEQIMDKTLQNLNIQQMHISQISEQIYEIKRRLRRYDARLSMNEKLIRESKSQTKSRPHASPKGFKRKPDFV